VRLPADAPLYLAGIEDPGRDWTEHGHGLVMMEKLAAAAPSDGPMLLLVHRPDAFVQAAALGFRLVLAGHFHGGQLALPIGDGRWNVARLLTPYHRGLYRLGEATLYVSRGLGFAGPRVRFGSRPEIAVLELV
jgi:predicted MPP superfamily phosphohydrolase